MSETKTVRTTKIKMLPCPFCGAAAEIEKWHGGDTGHKRMVSCPNEYCHVAPMVTGEREAVAIDRWNTRSR